MQYSFQVIKTFLNVFFNWKKIATICKKLKHFIYLCFMAKEENHKRQAEKKADGNNACVQIKLHSPTKL
jgi:hypothetical protein